MADEKELELTEEMEVTSIDAAENAEITPDEEPENTEEPDADEVATSDQIIDDEAQKIARRRGGMYLVAGLYVAYLGYQLCAGYVSGADGSGLGFFVGGIAFIGVGAVTAFFGIKGITKK